MNLFNLFGKKPQKSQNTKMFEQSETSTLEPQIDNIPPKDLFIDNDPPQLEKTIIQEQSKITLFLNRNYHSLGINDGYEYHAQEILETGKKKIKAEFQLIIDQSIQKKFESRLQLKNIIVDVTKISDDVREKLENTIEELNSSITILQMQKELSADNEGWVMNAIHSYHQGYIQGLNDWISSEQLLNSIKNI